MQVIKRGKRDKHTFSLALDLTFIHVTNCTVTYYVISEQNINESSNTDFGQRINGHLPKRTRKPNSNKQHIKKPRGKRPRGKRPRGKRPRGKGQHGIRPNGNGGRPRIPAFPGISLT